MRNDLPVPSARADLLSNPNIEILSFTLNGQPAQGWAGQTLLEAITPSHKIPCLCGDDIPGLRLPCPGCGLSVVEILGQSDLVPACSTPLEGGMTVMTFSRPVRRARLLALRELAKRHEGNCLTCERAGRCQLQSICADQGLALLSQPRPNPEFTLVPASGNLEIPAGNERRAQLSLAGR
ncbi:MAG: (2Fe-2S)-binding protein [Deltaproteobacteria bacterium]|jgi:predicted molibdopterin-dependent oxidoreductase YjgC|nr:(2Fe-2S)-binding protein [Deltaproteobacteria bacterium]